jgi:hypothetical protein
MSNEMSSFPFAFALLMRIINHVRNPTLPGHGFLVRVWSQSVRAVVLSSALGHSVRKHVNVHVMSCQLA